MRKVTSPELGNRIRKLRKVLRKAQKELAVSLDLAPSYLSEIEAGKIKPGYDFFVKITEQYPVNPMYLLHGQEPVLLDTREKESNWFKPGDFGEMYPMVHRMLWYIKKVPVVKLGMLESFERYFAEYEELIKKIMRNSDENYPGAE